MIRVRFAPSPTGNLHIGGARTALFNWLYAKAKGGKFILRIEDTDLVRSKKEFLDEILNSLKWMGLDWDELYHQGERFEIYRECANQLLAKGLAYRSKKVEEDGSVLPDAGEAIIFKVTSRKIKIDDMIHGGIEFDSAVIKDQVLIKSDGSPTYNFACVVDDAAMNITHIIRGDDHISNTPKQVILYDALGFKVPEFAHIPLILGTEGGRLSKRTGATAISEYRALGYLSPALVNYLLLLGWAPGENQELIELSEAVKKFDIKDANKTAAAFNLEKLNWINAHYLRSVSAEELLELARDRLSLKYALSNFDGKYIVSVVKLFQERINTLNELGDFSDFFFVEDVEISADAKKRLEVKDLSAEFAALLDRLKPLESWTHVAIEEAFRGLVKDLNIKAGELVHPVRAALTGKTIGPGLFELMEVLGKGRIEKRLGVFIKEKI